MKFHCNSCGQKLEVATIYAGQNTACPACSEDVSIPVGEAAVQPAEIDTAILETLVGVGSAAAGPQKTIAQFMTERKIEGGVKLGTEVLTGDQNRKYEYGDVVARGGMGAIIRASDLNVRRDVAIKVLLDPNAATNVEVLRFIEEAQVTGQLEHPGVVPVHDLGVDGAGNVYYAMKFVKGLTLHEILSKIAQRDEKILKEYSLNRLLNVFQKVCEAMAFAHSKEVIHRDLKPENIMVGEFGEVLVMDWGLAKVLGHSADDPYVSPEAINSVR
ncbi:MAG: serine/threonine protein kinase [Verrucomicrobiales bacterium]|jgi:serine/threonine protein kinase